MPDAFESHLIRLHVPVPYKGTGREVELEKQGPLLRQSIRTLICCRPTADLKKDDSGPPSTLLGEISKNPRTGKFGMLTKKRAEGEVLW